ncbi:MAG: GlxA family transcriptional regulator [Alteromonadaceae bacterium]|nr:GlxA family transcriptional regulator [Alteromonadaceae bacterium]
MASNQNDYNLSDSFLPPKFSESDTIHIAFILVDQFSLFALACLSEPLRVANRLADKSLFNFVFITDTGKPATASNGMKVDAQHSIHTCPSDYQTFIVVSGFDPMENTSSSLLAELRRLAVNGYSLGGVDTGSQILIKAGVMSGQRTTMHWEAASSFKEGHPTVQVLPERFLIDKNRISSSGGLSSLDMMLNIIWASHSYELAADVAEQFMYHRILKANDSQRMKLRNRLMTTNRKLIKAVALMEENLTKNLSIKGIAEKALVSQRELERLFSKELNTSPKRYYRKLRLEYARQLLHQTELSVLEISLACGFSSAAYLSAIYKQEFGIQPSKDRGLLSSP